MDQPLTQIFQFLQDEYDIFGRKKKKKNRGPGAVSGPSGSNGREETKKKQVKSYSLLQGDTSPWFLYSVDIKTKVPPASGPLL